MAVQTSVEQRGAQMGLQEDLRTPQDATQVTTQSQEEGNLLDRGSAALGKLLEQRPDGGVELSPRTRAIVLGAVVLAATGLFATGLMRTQLRQALRGLVDKVEEVDVPLLLPVAIAETVWEVVADMRRISAMRAS